MLAKHILIHHNHQQDEQHNGHKNDYVLCRQRHASFHALKRRKSVFKVCGGFMKNNIYAFLAFYRMLKRTLETIVSRLSRATRFLGEKEEEAFGAFLTLPFFVDHPVRSGFLTGAAFYATQAGIISLLGYDAVTFATEPRLLLGSSFLGIFFLRLFSQYKLAKTAGVDIRRLYHNSIKNKSASPTYGYYKGFSGVAKRLWDFPLQSPRLLALGGLAGYAAYTHHLAFSHGAPQAALPFYSIYPFVYLSLRYSFIYLGRTLHSSIASFSYHDIVGFSISQLTRNKNRKAEHLEAAVLSNPSKLSRMFLANAYLDAGRLDEALAELRRSFEEATDPLIYSKYSPAPWIYAVATAFTNIRRAKDTLVDYVVLSTVHQLADDSDGLSSAIENMRSRFPGIHSEILSALAFERLSPSQATIFWRSAVDKAVTDSSLLVQSFGEGINDVYRYGPSEFISSTFVFKRKQIEMERAHEQRVLTSLHSQLDAETVETYRAVPDVLFTSEHRNGGVSYDLVLRYFEGQDYPELRRQGKLTRDDLFKAVDFLFWIYSHTSPDWSSRGAVDFPSKLDNIFYGLQLPPALADSFASQKGLLLGFMNSDSPPVLAKDPHPYQWRKGNRQLMALDFDDMGVTNLFVDISKFLVHSKLPLSADELDDLMSFSYQRATEYGLYRSSEASFREHLLHAMLYQPLSFASAWGVPKLEHMRIERAPTLATADITLDLLAQNHGRSGNGYASLRSSFEEAKGLLQAT
jgi:hypothetical protein